MRSVGVHYKRWAYHPYDASLFIAWARELGYDQVELDARALMESSILTRTRIGFEARTHRIYLSYGWTSDQTTDLASLDETARRDATAHLGTLIKTIGQMGGGVLNGAFYAPFPPRWELSGDRERLLGQLVKSLRALAVVAEDEDVLLNIKPIASDEHFLIPTVERALACVQAVNHSSVSLDLDTYHMAKEEASIEAAIVQAGVYVKTVHVRDSNQGRVGEGVIDWQAVRRGLDAIHYDGPLIHNPTVTSEVVSSVHESRLIRSLLVDP